jgi:two-component system KDP operon response regulator KdpE
MDGHSALAICEERNPIMVIADIMMPEMDGFTLCKLIRDFSRVPIIILTAKLELEDKLRGFEIGVDDYITKPFSKEELLARVKSVLNRTQINVIPPATAAFQFGDLEINLQRRLVNRGGQELNLTQTEFRLLSELLLNKGKVLPFSYLLTAIWGSEYQDDTHYLHVIIRRLRGKIETDPKQPKHIQNVFGVGYEFRD